MNTPIRRGSAGPLSSLGGLSSQHKIALPHRSLAKRLSRCLSALALLAIAMSVAQSAVAQGSFVPGDVFALLNSPHQMVRVPALGEPGTSVIPFTPLTTYSVGQIAWSGDLTVAYATQHSNNHVVGVTSDGTVTRFADVGYPTGIVVLPGDRVLCASDADDCIYDITAGGTGPFPIYATVDSPRSLLRTSDGRILVCSTSLDQVVDITDPSSPTIFATLPSRVTDCIQLKDGRILCTSSSAVVDITEGGTFAVGQSVFASGRSFIALAQDRDGRILASVINAPGIFDITTGGNFSGASPTYTAPTASESGLDSVPDKRAAQYELLYVTKDAVPNAGEDPRIQADALWTNLGVPAVSESGDVAYLGKWKAPKGEAPRSQTGVGIFVDDDLIVKAGDPVPGLSGAVFRSFKAPVVDANGRVAFIATITGEGVTRETDSVVVTAGRTGSLEVVAREGDVTAGTSGARYRTFSSVSNQGGGTIFQATLQKGTGSPMVDRTNDTGVWWQPAGEFGSLLLVREGGPGFSGGETTKSFRVLKTTSGSAGQGRGQIAGARALIQVGLSTGRQAQLLAAPGTLTLVAITGDVLGGTALPEAEWTRMGIPSSGAAGTYISVLGALKSNVGGVLSANSKGIFASANVGGTWEPVAQTGTVAPGFGSAVFGGFKDPVNSATGAGVAFIGTAKGEAVTSLTNTGIWWQPRGGALALIAREGDQPAGAPDGAQWKAFSSLALPGGSTGPLFTATLHRGKGAEAGPGGITSIDDAALYSTSSTGTVSELLRENQEITSLERTVKKFNVLRAVSGSAGTTRAFNSVKEVLLQVTFTDRTIGIVKIKL